MVDLCGWVFAALLRFFVVCVIVCVMMVFRFSYAVGCLRASGVGFLSCVFDFLVWALGLFGFCAFAMYLLWWFGWLLVGSWFDLVGVVGFGVS